MNRGDDGLVEDLGESPEVVLRLEMGDERPLALAELLRSPSAVRRASCFIASTSTSSASTKVSGPKSSRPLPACAASIEARGRGCRRRRHRLPSGEMRPATGLLGAALPRATRSACRRAARRAPCRGDDRGRDVGAGGSAPDPPHHRAHPRVASDVEPVRHAGIGSTHDDAYDRRRAPTCASRPLTLVDRLARSGFSYQGSVSHWTLQSRASGRRELETSAWSGSSSNRPNP